MIRRTRYYLSLRRRLKSKSMGRFSLRLAVVLLAIAAVAQQSQKNTDPVQDADAPVANPGRPTVSTPATLTPTGYFQFESGVLSAWKSPQFSSQTSANEVIKFAVCRRLEFLAGIEPVAHSVLGGPSSND